MFEEDLNAAELKTLTGVIIRSFVINYLFSHAVQIFKIKSINRCIHCFIF